MPRPAYLDYNATAPIRPAVIAAMAEAMATVGNPSSVHGFGRAARAQLESAREQVAELVGARADQVVFTSGGTEANNLAVAGAGRPRVLASAVEHDSVLKAGVVEAIPVRSDGIVDLGALDEILRHDGPPALVSIMLANNETGVVQPVGDAVRRAHAQGALVHCDAVQATGKIAVDFASLGVDLISLSAHKFGGPPGVGALVVGDDVAVQAVQRGGGQERGRRAGTENLPAIVGFGVAAEAARSDLQAAGKLAAWRDAMEARISAVAPAAIVFGREAPRLPNTSCIALPGLSSELQVMALDLAGVAVSAGSACSSGKLQPSHVLRAMGADPLTAASAIRVSLGWQTEADHIDRFIAAWGDLVARSRRRADVALTAA
ncbi:MAG TPA: cysteine desulfurase family protein [Methylomirabilota bacterium]|nr:cysteine desulfurase family protein [Methylomirabilota bacterium]